MNAEQYRALVAKLEAINPSEPVLEAPVAAFNQDAAATDATATNSGSSYTGSVGTATNDPAPAPAADPNQIPTIEAATFSQAYAQARKQGLKKFKWCGVYAVKDKVNPQPVPPKPVPQTDTIPTTRTGVVAEPNDWKGRLQAGERNLI
jgi:hypothetical protein